MNDLLKELEAVVVVMRKGSPRQAIDAFDFLSTHHAEIAEALKDARRYRWLKQNATEQTGEYGEAAQLYFGTYRAGPLELDAAIDAAMHNSAREDGERHD